LIRRYPVPDPGSQPLGTLHPSYACRQLGAQGAGVRCLISKPPNGGEPNIDRRWSEILPLEEEPVSQYNGPIEREARLRAVPPDELIDGVTVGFLRACRRERAQNRIFRLFEIRERKVSLACAVSPPFADVPYGRPPVPRGSVWREGTGRFSSRKTV